MLQGNECYVYTDLTTAKPQYSAPKGIDYSFYSRPIDLSKGPTYRRPSQRGDLPELDAIAPVMAVPQQVYPGQGQDACLHGAGAVPKASRKPQKRPPADGDGQYWKTKWTGKTNTLKGKPFLVVLLEQSDEQLFSCVVCSNHCLFICCKCPCNPEVILLIYRGINTTSPGRLLFFEIYVQIGNYYYMSFVDLRCNL